MSGKIPLIALFFMLIFNVISSKTLEQKLVKLIDDFYLIMDIMQDMEDDLETEVNPDLKREMGQMEQHVVGFEKTQPLSSGPSPRSRTKSLVEDLHLRYKIDVMYKRFKVIKRDLIMKVYRHFMHKKRFMVVLDESSADF